MHKLNLSFAFDPELTSDLLTAPLFARLEKCCNILALTPLRDYSARSAISVLAETEILFTGWGAPRLDVEALAASPKLRLIAHAGSAVKPIAAQEVWQAGITVTSAAAANAAPVAEFALAAILFSNKRVFSVCERFRRERQLWLPQWLAPGEAGNYGSAIGIVGASRIGRRLIELLKPFDLDVRVCDPFLSDEEARTLGVQKTELLALLHISNIVTLHAPSLPETVGMIGRAELAAMQNGATLINTARGSLVDHEALLEELLSGRISAVLDVTEPEPLPSDSRLFDLPNVFLTPHVAGAAGLETRRMTELLVDEIERFIAGKPLQHAVTIQMLDRVA